MSLRSDFLNHPAWGILAPRIEQKIIEITESAFAMLAAGKFAEASYNAGYRDALRDMLNLPSILLRDKDEPPPEDAKFIRNHPNSPRGNW
jgi:hypothetical protein